MATAYITEYSGLGIQQGIGVPAPKEPALASQSVSYTSSTQSSALNAKTRLVKIHPDAAAHIAVGSNPTATASSEFLAADTDHWRSVNGGEKIAVYDGTT